MEAALPPVPSPQLAFSLPQGMAPLLTGPSVGECQLKRLRANGGQPSGPSRQLPPTLVTPDR
jgi:hypothetical protein